MDGFGLGLIVGALLGTLFTIVLVAIGRKSDERPPAPKSKSKEEVNEDLKEWSQKRRSDLESFYYEKEWRRVNEIDIMNDLVRKGLVRGQKIQVLISEYTAEQVIIRDKNRCIHCGALENLIFHYIKPISDGGLPIANNLRILCQDCASKVIS